MIKRRTVLKLMAAPALMTVARPGFARAKEKVTYAYLLDPAYDAVTWAMSNGKVTSDLIDGRSARARDPATDPGHLGQAVRRDHDRGDRHSAGGGARPRAEGAVDGASAIAGGRRRRHLGQERLADQESEGAQGQDARLLCAALDRLHPGASGAHQEVRPQRRARRRRSQAGRDPGAQPARRAGGRSDRRRDADPQPGLSRAEVRRVPPDCRDRSRQHRGLRHALHQRAQRVVSGTSGAAAGRLQGIQPHVPRVGALRARAPRRGVRRRRQADQPAAGVLQLVVREELRRARHVRGKPRPRSS